MNIEKMHSVALTIAKYLSIKHQGEEQIASHFVILFDDKLVIYPGGFVDDEEKLMYRNTACVLMRAFNATGYFLLTEAWTLPSSVLEGLSRHEVASIQHAGICNHPARREILAIWGENDTHVLMANNSIARDESGGVTLLEQLNSDLPPFSPKSKDLHAEGIFSNCLQVCRELDVPDAVLSAVRQRFSTTIETIQSIEEQLRLMVN